MVRVYQEPSTLRPAHLGNKPQDVLILGARIIHLSRFRKKPQARHRRADKEINRRCEALSFIVMHTIIKF